MAGSSLSPSMLKYATALGADVTALTTTEGDAQEHAESLDEGHPLSHYFISSSHNTYLWGNQLYGRASALHYQQVLERGCRCVEIDVWDGEDAPSSASSSDAEAPKPRRKLKDELKSELSERIKKWRPGADRAEPRVLHGHTATKDCSFREVVETIGLHAFTRSDLPLIVSLEIHTSHQQQEIMVEIMNEYWSSYLINVKDSAISDNTPLPTIDQLRKKILIKVKYTPPPHAPEPAASSQATTKYEDSSEDEFEAVSVDKGKIIPALGRLGVYTRASHFSHFDQPEAKVPTHVFSLSEKKIASVHAKEPGKLFQHNKNYLMRVFPKGLRVASSNLDPAVSWRLGVQMAALNWQYVNEGTMINHAMFDGSKGYVLKPPGYRDAPGDHAAAIEVGTLDLLIEVFAGQNLGPRGKKLRACIRCELHVEQGLDRKSTDFSTDAKAKEGEYKRYTATAKEGRDPDFGGQKLEFRGIRATSDDLAFVRMKVMDDESFQRDELVAWASFRLKRLRSGVRLVHVYDTEGKLTDGRLLVRVTKRFSS